MENLEILTFLFNFYNKERCKAIFLFCFFTKQYANYVVETLLKVNVNIYVLIYPNLEYHCWDCETVYGIFPGFRCSSFWRHSRVCPTEALSESAHEARGFSGELSNKLAWLLWPFLHNINILQKKKLCIKI